MMLVDLSKPPPPKRQLVQPLPSQQPTTPENSSKPAKLRRIAPVMAVADVCELPQVPGLVSRGHRASCNAMSLPDLSTPKRQFIPHGRPSCSLEQSNKSVSAVAVAAAVQAPPVMVAAASAIPSESWEKQDADPAYHWVQPTYDSLNLQNVDIPEKLKYGSDYSGSDAALVALQMLVDEANARPAKRRRITIENVFASEAPGSAGDGASIFLKSNHAPRVLFRDAEARKSGVGPAAVVDGVGNPTSAQLLGDVSGDEVDIYTSSCTCVDRSVENNKRVELDIEAGEGRPSRSFRTSIQYVVEFEPSFSSWRIRTISRQR